MSISRSRMLANLWMENQYQTCLLNLQNISYQSSAIPNWTFTVSQAQWGPRAHLPVTYFQFHSTTFHLVLVLRNSHTSSHSAVSDTLHLDVIWRPATFSQPMLPPWRQSPMRLLESLLRFWPCINRLITYSLGWSAVCCNRRMHRDCLCS